MTDPSNEPWEIDTSGWEGAEPERPANAFVPSARVTDSGLGSNDRKREADALAVRVQKREEAEFCLRMRKAGHSYRDIAHLAGAEFSRPFTPGQVARRIDAELARYLRLTGEDLARRRAMELMKLDDAERKVLGVLSRTHYLVNGGKIVRDEEGVPLEDDGPILASVDRLVKISERRAKFEGLDAPTRVDAQVTHVQVDPRVSELIENARQKILAERADAVPAVESPPAESSPKDAGAVEDAEFSDDDEDGFSEGPVF